MSDVVEFRNRSKPLTPASMTLEQAIQRGVTDAVADGLRPVLMVVKYWGGYVIMEKI